MEKRFIITMVLFVGIFVAWKTFLAPKAPNPIEKKDSLQNKEPVTLKPTDTLPPSPLQLESPQRLLESLGLYKMQVTKDGLLHQVTIEDKKYESKNAHILVSAANGSGFEKKERTGYQPTEMIPTPLPSLQISFPNSSFTVPINTTFQEEILPSQVACNVQGNTLEKNGLLYSVIPEQGCSLAYRLEIPGKVRLRKILRFVKNSPQIQVKVEVTNLGKELLKHHLQVALAGYQDPEQKTSLFSQRVPQNDVIWCNSGKMYKSSLGDLLEKKELDKKDGDLCYVAIGQQYFIQAIGLPSEKIIGHKTLQASAESNGLLSASVIFAEKEPKPEESATYQFVWYGGPKIPEELQGIKVGDEYVGLDNSIDYTFGFLARPLLFVLRHLYQLIHNWALAIVLLTLGVKLLTLYPAYLGQRSMKRMSDLKPQMDALREKYANDKQKLNQEMMNLYRQHGINPLGGCLPMLLQMPIYIALYSMLGNAVELYHSPLITEKWIQDLTSSDPYYILPLLTGGLMFLQTRLSPASPDPQQKMMTYLMPLMFTAFSIFLPAGLTLYILTNTLLGIIQQLVTNRLQKKSPTHVSKK